MMHTNDTIPDGYCQCGCGRQTTISPATSNYHGYVKGKPRRFVKGHNGSTRGLPPVPWIEEDRGYITPCWIWQYSLTKQGYAQRWMGNGPMLVHRVMYEQVKGPIPPGLELDHLCRQKSCVNPEHTEPVTKAENGRRAQSCHE